MMTHVTAVSHAASSYHAEGLCSVFAHTHGICDTHTVHFFVYIMHACIDVYGFRV